MSKSCLTGTFLTTTTRKPHLYPCSRGLIMNEISLSLHFNEKSLVVKGTLQTVHYSSTEFDIISLL